MGSRQKDRDQEAGKLRGLKEIEKQVIVNQLHNRIFSVVALEDNKQIYFASISRLRGNMITTDTFGFPRSETANPNDGIRTRTSAIPQKSVSPNEM
jgi:hypothetical protein